MRRIRVHLARGASVRCRAATSSAGLTRCITGGHDGLELNLLIVVVVVVLADGGLAGGPGRLRSAGSPAVAGRGSFGDGRFDAPWRIFIDGRNRLLGAVGVLSRSSRGKSCARMWYTRARRTGLVVRLRGGHRRIRRRGMTWEGGRRVRIAKRSSSWGIMYCIAVSVDYKRSATTSGHRVMHNRVCQAE